MTSRAKEGDMNEKWRRNVGTDHHPESYLHARAVACLWDALHGFYGEKPLLAGTKATGMGSRAIRVNLQPGGPMSGNLLEGVTKVKVPDPEWDQVGGVVPDLTLLGPNDRPVRIIEVIVNSPPTKTKREKLDRLQRRGVDVIEVEVSLPDDILNLCWERSFPSFGSKIRTHWANGNGKLRQRMQIDMDKEIDSLITSLKNCSPAKRRELYDVLKHLDSVESLAPISPDNPLKEKLQR